MLEEVIESLAIKPNGIYVDGTLGGAGHSSEIAKRLGPEGRLIGIDQDGEAIAAATQRLSLEFLLISLIMQSVVLHIVKMFHWICVWISVRRRRQGTL